MKRTPPTGPLPPPVDAPALIASLDPLSRERVADWLLAQATNKDNVIAFERAWLEAHPEDRGSKRQLDYWESYQSICKHLAFLMRGFRPGSRTGTRST